jgi:hypothetical protein
VSRSIISLGDALRVCADLRPEDEEARQALRDLLGVESDTTIPAPASLGAWLPSSSHNLMTSQRKATAEKEGLEVTPPEKAFTGSGAASSSPSSDRMSSRSTLTLVTRRAEQPTPPVWLAQVPALGALDEPGANPPTQPLFDRLRRRGLLSSALATHVAEGDLDIERIVAIVSAGQPLQFLPRLPVPTLRRGVQVLLDVGQGMDPFAEDQRGLVRALDDVLADDRLEVLRFNGCPTRGVQGESESRYRAWRPPPNGVPLLAVTDLGIGGPMLDRERATASEWLAFAHRVREAGYDMVVLVPYEATRWPRRLQSTMKLIHWSERTTVGAVRRALRDGRRRLNS